MAWYYNLLDYSAFLVALVISIILYAMKRKFYPRKYLYGTKGSIIFGIIGFLMSFLFYMLLPAAGFVPLMLFTSLLLILFLGIIKNRIRLANSKKQIQVPFTIYVSTRG